MEKKLRAKKGKGRKEGEKRKDASLFLALSLSLSSYLFVPLPLSVHQGEVGPSCGGCEKIPLLWLPPSGCVRWPGHERPAQRRREMTSRRHEGPHWGREWYSRPKGLLGKDWPVTCFHKRSVYPPASSHITDFLWVLGFHLSVSLSRSLYLSLYHSLCGSLTLYLFPSSC